MIHIENLTKCYGEQTVLCDLNLHIAPGEFAFLQGRSGSGKSTLLKLLYREEEQYGGTIKIDSILISEMSKHELRRKMGIIFQSFELLERKTVLENVALAGEVFGKGWADIESDVYRLLQRVGLNGKEHHFPHQLSGGEQQRVAIVRALLNKPKLILADEPTGNLDTETAFDVLHLLKELHVEEGIAMLVVTHSEQLMQAFPAKTWVMEDGRVHESARV
ncbi:cell division ATP-binding protein FtsE [Peribacillus asahii]|uniref:cell division ATP-binding protein FtsE n=1 Tax=Peribacillus asahii TaxID=228899 RepID=UPI002079A28D|nr:ABC transporter ATP-binding protein [Peribacillus asahii]USK70258.1 ABC transporter ATP-binding protein [Peribacillus asahii]